MICDATERSERLDALAVRYRAGEFSTAVYEASLYSQGLRGDDIRAAVYDNLAAFQQSMAFKRGSKC
jgi:hypothetical protein